MEWSKRTKLIATVLIFAIAIVSFGLCGEKYSEPETYAKSIDNLNDKSGHVLALATASAAISTGLTMIPGDTAEPIANKMADMSGIMMAILCAIFLEKYMLTLSGAVTFRILIPLACVLIAGYVWSNRAALKTIATKLIVVGMALVLLVPISTTVTAFVEETYSVSYKSYVSDAETLANDFNENASDDENAVSKWLGKVKGGFTGMMNNVKATFSNMIEAAALMIVTSCILPVLTMVALLWLLNMVLGANIPIGKLASVTTAGSKMRKKAVGGSDLPAEID